MSPSTDIRLEWVRLAANVEDWSAVVVEAEELLDVEPNHGLALLYLANACLELGDPLNAAAAFAQHLELEPATSDALSGLAVARFESCDIAGALTAARAAVRHHPDLAEAHYTLGLALERTRGGNTEAASCFAAATTLDPAAYPWPLALDDDTLQRSLLRAIHRIPAALARFWSGVPMRLEEQPTIDELVRGPTPISPNVAGLYLGMPPAPDVSEDDAVAMRPTALRLFRRNLSRCGDLDQVVELLTVVLVEEALDWLGLPLTAFD